MTLIIGKRCQDGVILAADRRSLRGMQPIEHLKIRSISVETEKAKSMVLLAGAGVSSFWDEVAWSLEQYIATETDPKPKTFPDIVSGVSSVSINLYTRLQRGGTDEMMGCVLAGLDSLSSGKAKLYYFAGAGFSDTEFICLGSGDTYALPLADLLLNTADMTVEKAMRFLPLIFLLVERVTLSVAGGPDIFIVKDDEQPVQVESSQIREIRAKASNLSENLPNILWQNGGIA